MDDVIHVGVPDFENAPGAVRQYVRTGTNWTEQAVLTDSASTDVDDSFGWGAVMHDGALIVGGVNTTDGAFLQVLEPSGTNWIEGVRQMIGAPYYIGTSSSFRGTAWVYERSGTNWVRAAELNPGWLDGDRAVAGAPGVTVDGHEEAGCAHVFVRVTTNVWVREARLVAPDPQPDGAFGASVSLCGDRLVVGAPAYNRGTAPGSAYLFQRSGTNWVPRTISIDGLPEQAWFGFATALDDHRILIGSPTESGTGLGGEFSFQQGRVRIFDLVEPYGNWVETQGLMPGISDGLLDDPDGDSARNLYEYATGTSATNPISFAPVQIDSSSTGTVVRFTRNPDALDATLVLERNVDLPSTAAWIGGASNVWGQWSGNVEVFESGAEPRSVMAPTGTNDPSHAAYRLDVRTLDPE